MTIDKKISNENGKIDIITPIVTAGVALLIAGSAIIGYHLGASGELKEKSARPVINLTEGSDVEYKGKKYIVSENREGKPGFYVSKIVTMTKDGPFITSETGALISKYKGEN